MALALPPPDLHFDMDDLLETDSKDSVDIEAADPLHPQHPGTYADESIAASHEPADYHDTCRHYDPQYRWTAREETKVVRKIDLRVGLLIGLMFFALQIDRSNIAQIALADTLHHFNITASEYHAGQTIYFLSSLLAALPSQLIGKHLGAEVWIPLQLIIWGLVTGSEVGIDGPWALWFTRCVLGILEGGFVPSCVLYLSNYYTSGELPKRLSWFWAGHRFIILAGHITTKVVLTMSGLDRVPEVGWLPASEGIMTFLVGCFAWLYMPSVPTQVVSKFQTENGCFSVAEEKILVNRVLREDPSKGDMHHGQGLTWKNLRDSICDYHMFPLYLLGLSWHITVFPAGQYLAKNLLASGVRAFEIPFKTVTSDVLWILNVLALTYLSEWLNERLLLCILSQIWVLPELVALTYIDIAEVFKDQFHLTMLIIAQPFAQALLLGLVSRNSGSVRTRTVSVAIYTACVQASTLIGAFIYDTDEVPYHFRGSRIFIVVTVYNMFMFMGVKWFYWNCNQRREFRWETMSRHDRLYYLTNTRDEGNKRLTFYFKH